jgi:hypothetical protein
MPLIHAHSIKWDCVMQNIDRFVCNGHERARAAIEPQIRAAVSEEFADRWQAASLWQHFWLRREIEREVNRRLEKVAPSNALY